MFVFKKKKTFPYPLKYASDQHAIGTKEISGEWERGNSFSTGTCIFKEPLPSPTLPGSSCALSYRYTKLTELTMKNVSDFSYRGLVRHHIFSKLSYCVQKRKLLTSEGHIFNQHFANLE